jgi:hypothetical protein
VLLDPDGNSVEAVHHGGTAGGVIDHLWVGVADVASAKRFYELAAPFSGFTLSTELPESVHFRGANASFGLVARQPAQNWHFAFETHDNDTVDAFHRTLTQAGYRDNGPPGGACRLPPRLLRRLRARPRRHERRGREPQPLNHNR